MRRRWTFGVAALTAATLAGPAAAAITYQYVTDTPAVFAAVSSPVAVKIFLRETVTGADTSILLSDGGLDSAGVSVTTLASSPTTITSPGFQPNTATTSPKGFPGGLFSEPAGTTTSRKASESTAPPPATGAESAPTGAAGVRQVFLFTLSLQTGSTANQTTTFTLGQFGGSGNTLTFTHGYDIDVTNNGLPHTGATGSTFTVTTPEPAGLGLLLGAAGAGLLRRQRRRECRRTV